MQPGNPGIRRYHSFEEFLAKTPKMNVKLIAHIKRINPAKTMFTTIAENSVYISSNSAALGQQILC